MKKLEIGDNLSCLIFTLIVCAFIIGMAALGVSC